MTEKPKLRLIKSEEYEEELHIRSFNYSLLLQGTFTVEGSDPDELEEICRIGESLIDDPTFREDMCRAVYDLVAQRIGADNPDGDDVA